MISLLIWNWSVQQLRELRGVKWPSKQYVGDLSTPEQPVCVPATTGTNPGQESEAST